MMTKTPVVALLGLLLVAPTALAHGDIPPRDIDTRVAIDANSLTVLDYGAANGLHEDANGRDSRLPYVPLYEGGHDHMTLDLREAYGPEGGAQVPGIYFRLTFRRGDPTGQGITDTISFKADGAEKSVAFTTKDNLAYTGIGLSWVSARLEPGTYEFAVEGFASYASLGVLPGAKLTEVNTLSTNDGKDTDVMPGTYHYGGQYVPDDAQVGVGFGVPPTVTATPENGPLEYTLQGPARLAALASTVTQVDLSSTAKVVVPITLKADKTTLDQLAALSVQAPAGIKAALSQTSAKLGNGTPETRLELVVESAGATMPGEIRIVADTDLGGHAELTLATLVPAPASDGHGHVHPASPGQAGAHDHQGRGAEGDDPDAEPPGEENAKASPSAAVAPLLALVLVAAIQSRRK